MANNRLYLGDKKDKVYLMISKGFGDGWEGLYNKELFNEFLFNKIGESDIGGKTDLFLFTEYSEDYDMIMKGHKDFKEARSG